MAAGRWQADTGETIKFDTAGRLIDGQNRLHAVVEAGVPIVFVVARNVAPEAMQVIDTGSARTLADALVIAGSTIRFQAAAVVRWVALWDKGNHTSVGGSKQVTNSELLALYRADPGLYDAAGKRGADANVLGLGVSSAVGTAYVLFHRINREETHQFFDHYVSGANLPDRHPILTLRNRMMRTRADRITKPEQLALMIRGWNGWRTRDANGDPVPLATIMISRDRLSNTNFPKPR